MKKVFILSLATALGASLLIPASASALDTDQGYNAVIRKGNKKYDVGTLYFTLESNHSKTCNYYVEWEKSSGSISTECEVAEYKTSGHKSCLSNSEEGFSTIVRLADDCECEGFDRYDQKRQVLNLVLSEDSSSDMEGLIQFDGYDVQSIELEGD